MHKPGSDRTEQHQLTYQLAGFRVGVMSEEMDEAERYVMEIGPAVVAIVDTKSDRVVMALDGGDRLLAATGYLQRMNRGETITEPEPGYFPAPAPEVTPAEFLSKTLPAYARTQRADALLAELDEIERISLEHVRGHSEILARAVKLREKLLAERDREASASPLSATLSAATAPEAVPDPPRSIQAHTDAQSPDPVQRASWRPEFSRSKPGPY